VGCLDLVAALTFFFFVFDQTIMSKSELVLVLYQPSHQLVADFIFQLCSFVILKNMSKV